MSPLAQEFLIQHKLDPVGFNQFIGTSIQQQYYKETVMRLERAADFAQQHQAIPALSQMTESTVAFSQLAYDLNKQGQLEEVNKVADLLLHIEAYTKGAAIGALQAVQANYELVKTGGQALANALNTAATNLMNKPLSENATDLANLGKEICIGIYRLILPEKETDNILWKADHLISNIFDQEMKEYQERMSQAKTDYERTQVQGEAFGRIFTNIILPKGIAKALNLSKPAITAAITKTNNFVRPLGAAIQKEFNNIAVLANEYGTTNLKAVLDKIGINKLVDGKLTLFEQAEQELRWGFWRQFPKTVIDGEEYAKIGNHYYRRHAIERMIPSEFGRVPHKIEPFYTRGIPTFAVEETIRFGKIVPSTNSAHVAKKLGDIKVIIKNDNIIVSVFRETSK